MPIERRLKDLILDRYGTLRDFTPNTGLSYSTVDSILRRGIKNASVGNVISICRALGISADELANGRIVQVSKNDWQKRNETDVSDLISFIKMNIENYDYLTLDGEPMTQSELEMFIDGMNFTLEMIKRNRKRES